MTDYAEYHALQDRIAEQTQIVVKARDTLFEVVSAKGDHIEPRAELDKQQGILEQLLEKLEEFNA